MIFGYNAVMGFLHSGEQVQFVQFKSDLENSVKKIYTEYGSVRIEEFNLPAQYSKICFIDMDAEPNPQLATQNQVAYSIWQDARESRTEFDQTFVGYDNTDENVFLTPESPVKIKVFRLSIENDFLCLPVINGKFTLVLEGKGDRTEISEVTE